MTKQVIYTAIISLAIAAPVVLGDDNEGTQAKRSVDVELRFPKATDRDEMVARAKRFRAAFKDLGHESLALGDVRSVLGNLDEAASAILSFTRQTPMHEMQSVIEICRKLEFEMLSLTAGGVPNWNKFTPDAFEKARLKKPAVLALMRDLCPGCKAKRDALWSDKEVKAALEQRDVFLFFGNAATDTGLAEHVRKTFAVGELPVVIITSTPIKDEPLVLSGIPEPEQVIKALAKKIPVDAKD